MDIKTTKKDIEQAYPLEHYFSDGVYCRVISIPANNFIVGKKHITNHLNVLLSGIMLMHIDGETKEIMAPFIFEAYAGSVKALITMTDCKVMNIHPTDKKNVDDIEPDVVDNSYRPNCNKL